MVRADVPPSVWELAVPVIAAGECFIRPGEGMVSGGGSSGEACISAAGVFALNTPAALAQVLRVEGEQPVGVTGGVDVETDDAAGVIYAIDDGRASRVRIVDGDRGVVRRFDESVRVALRIEV